LFFRPDSLAEALDVLANTNATVLAGGTDLFPASTGSQLRGPIMDISAIAELKGIRVTPDGVHIGGRTTWTEILAASLPRGFDGLRAAAREIGSVQIQNQATIGGNICNASPAADGVVALMALDAEVHLASRSASRTISLAAFVQGNRKTALDPQELLTAIRIPHVWDQAASAFSKLGARRYLVISIVMVAANLVISPECRIERAAVCVGSCSSKALRLAELERALVGVRADSSMAKLMGTPSLADLSPIDDIRATAAYRREAAETLVRRTLEQCASKVRQ
jgi:CO/xanthine dehydrogenase FAD-binding subunit